MIADQTGSLAGIKRHDYLPFGEELFAGTGGRTVGKGYTGDSVRQKFTQKERDDETGLDYFLARYYSSIQGRFTSEDPASLGLRQLVNPQDINRYAYVANNPLKFIDPNGAEKIQIVVNTFIPQKTVTAPIVGRIFEGDDRNVGESGSFRTQQIITVETDPSRGAAESSYAKDTGITREFNSDGSQRGETGRASGDSLQYLVTRDDSGVNIHVKGDEKDPLITPAAGITYDFYIKVQSRGTQGDATVTVSGGHDKFPGYEIMATRQEQPKPATSLVYGYDPRTTRSTAKQLLPGNWHTINPPARTVMPGQSPPLSSQPRRKRGKRGDD
jgi:RHS repeat-associated protein